MENNIAILGRGKSLNKFSKFSHLFDKIYIVGCFYKEIKKMGIKHFQNKDIIHVISRTDRPLRNNYYEKLNISRIQTLYTSNELKPVRENQKGLLETFKGYKVCFIPDYMKKRGYPSAPREIILKYSKKYNYIELCSFLEKKFPKKIEKEKNESRRTRYWPTTGIFALDLALVENNPKNFYIFGIDALKNLNYVIYNFDFKITRETPATKLMFYHISQMVKEFSSTEFYSSSKYIKFNYSNWHLI